MLCDLLHQLQRHIQQLQAAQPGLKPWPWQRPVALAAWGEVAVHPGDELLDGALGLFAALADFFHQLGVDRSGIQVGQDAWQHHRQKVARHLRYVDGALGPQLGRVFQIALGLAADGGHLRQPTSQSPQSGRGRKLRPQQAI